MNRIEKPGKRNSPMDESSGEEATIMALAGGRGLQSRLISMGLKVGSQVRVVRGGAGTWGPILIALGQARLAIGRGMADRIMVCPNRGQRPP